MNVHFETPLISDWRSSSILTITPLPHYLWRPSPRPVAHTVGAVALVVYAMWCGLTHNKFDFVLPLNIEDSCKATRTRSPPNKLLMSVRWAAQSLWPVLFIVLWSLLAKLRSRTLLAFWFDQKYRRAVVSDLARRALCSIEIEQGFYPPHTVLYTMPGHFNHLLYVNIFPAALPGILGTVRSYTKADRLTVIYEEDINLFAGQ